MTKKVYTFDYTDKAVIIYPSNFKVEGRKPEKFLNYANFLYSTYLKQLDGKPLFQHFINEQLKLLKPYDDFNDPQKARSDASYMVFENLKNQDFRDYENFFLYKNHVKESKTGNWVVEYEDRTGDVVVDGVQYSSLKLTSVVKSEYAQKDYFENQRPLTANIPGIGEIVTGHSYVEYKTQTKAYNSIKNDVYFQSVPNGRPETANIVTATLEFEKFKIRAKFLVIPSSLAQKGEAEVQKHIKAVKEQDKKIGFNTQPQILEQSAKYALKSDTSSLFAKSTAYLAS